MDSQRVTERQPTAAETTRQALKWAAYVLLYALLVVLQTGLLPHIAPLGVHPSLPPLMAAMVAVYEGGVSGAVFGVFAGLCLDALIPPFEAAHTIYFFLSGLLIGGLVHSLLKKSFLAAVLLSLASLFVLDLLLLVLFYFIPRRAGLSAVSQTLLPELVWSALCAPLVFWPVRAVWRWGNVAVE